LGIHKTFPKERKGTSESAQIPLIALKLMNLRKTIHSSS